VEKQKKQHGIVEKTGQNPAILGYFNAKTVRNLVKINPDFTVIRLAMIKMSQNFD